MRFILIFLFGPLIFFAQKSEQKSAYQYYINGEYSKAILIYEKMTINKSSVRYYTPFITSLIKSNRYKEAKKLASRMSSFFSNDLIYRIDLGISYQMLGDNRRAKKTYNDVYLKMKGNRNQTNSLANRFIIHEMYDDALNVYLSAEKINNNVDFSFKKAELYSSLDKNNLMLDEYLKYLYKNPSNKAVITSRIQRFLDNDGIKSDINYNLVKDKLLLYVNRYVEREDFCEILIWLFMQNNQFEMALLQAKALDLRGSKDGSVVFDLASTFLDNEEYLLSIDAYDYILNQERHGRFFIDANINKLFAMTHMVNSEQELDEVDNLYRDLISKLGKNKNTILLFANYAHFQAFYLHDLNSASNTLKDAMDINQISIKDLAECKLEYADIQLLLNNIWDALLYYSQVEKDFKESPIGHEAKLRRAKVSYYQGDFDWAQAQLNILKGSTSKLIANDALDLSLLITDNYNLDTSDVAMNLFAKADLLVYQRNFFPAIVKYDSIITIFPGHMLSDEVYMRKADIYLELDSVDLALSMYDKIISEFSYDILADDALYNKAKIYDYKLKDYNKAMVCYERLITNYNSSIFVSHSRKRFRVLRGDNLNISQ